jgi:MFS family permease
VNGDGVNEPGTAGAEPGDGRSAGVGATPPPPPAAALVVPAAAAAPPTAEAPSTYRDALRSREFRGLVVAQVLSEWGDNIARVALASVVLARTDSAFLAVLAFVVGFLPAFLGGALLTGLADRLPRKTVLLGCDAGRAVLIAVLALLAVPRTPVWVLLLVLLLAEFFTAPFEAAQRALVPDLLVEPRRVLAGMGLMRVLFQVDQVVGILLAGAVVYTVEARWGLAIDAATFALSFLVLLLVVRPRPAARPDDEADGSLLADVRGGWRVITRDPALRALVGLGWGAAVFLIVPEAVALAYARADGAAAAAGAALMAAGPAGAAVGAYAVGRLAPARQVRLLVPLAVFTCLPLLAACVAPPWTAALGLFFVSGLGQGFMVPLLTTVNLLAPRERRGQVNGLAGSGFSVATAAAFLLGGALADATSPALSVTAAGTVGLAVVGVVYKSWPRAALRRAAREVYAG